MADHINPIEADRVSGVASNSSTSEPTVKYADTMLRAERAAKLNPATAIAIATTYAAFGRSTAFDALIVEDYG